MVVGKKNGGEKQSVDFAHVVYQEVKGDCHGKYDQRKIIEIAHD